MDFLIFCATIVVIYFIYKLYESKKHSCVHEWETPEIEYTESSMGWNKYKTITQKCKKCGRVIVDTYDINHK